MLRLGMVLILASPALAADIHVPGDAPSIPAAIALAQDGDTIHVAPGTWAAAVDFLGKSVRLVSDAGFATTTIDGGPAATYAVSIPAGAGTSLLAGFTVIGGTTGRLHVDDDASVQRCRLGSGPGFGVLLTGDTTGLRILSDCLVQGNALGGVVAAGISRIERCVIDGNGSPAVFQGGGIYGDYFTDVLDCVVSHNTAQFGGGAVNLGSFDGTLFLGNHATVSGGGYWFYAYLDVVFDPQLKGATFLDNTAPTFGGLDIPDPGFAESPVVTVSDCTFAGNQDGNGNVGLHSGVNTSFLGFTKVDRCTFVDNRINTLQKLVLTNSIVRGGAPLLVAGAGGLPFNVTWCDIQGGWPGTGNFDKNPRFVDPAHDVYALLPSSGCIDAGDPLAPPDPDGSRADVGALPLDSFADAREAHFGLLGLPELSGAGDLLAGSPLTLSLVRGKPGATAALIMGFTALHAPLKGGVLVPSPQIVIVGLAADATGELALAATWPAGVPAGLAAWVQIWIADAAAEGGFSASNGLGLVAL